MIQNSEAAAAGARLAARLQGKTAVDGRGGLRAAAGGMQAVAAKRRRGEASPFEEASPPGSARELVENLEASAAYRLERALATIDAQASEIERLQGEIGRLRHVEGQRALLAADQGRGVASSAESSRLVADLQADTGKLQAQLETSQSEARTQAQRAAEADRRHQQLLREYEVAESDRLRLASQLKEAVDDLQRSSPLGDAGALPNEESLKRQNEELRESLALADSSLASAKRSHANELATAQARTEARQARIEELQQDLDTANTALAASRKASRQTDELEAQLLRARCDLREQQRLAENAEVVRSLQSALHAHSADVAAARRIKQKSDNAEALNEEIAALRTKLDRAEKAAENATRQQVEHEARASELDRWRAVGTGFLTGSEQAAVTLSVAHRLASALRTQVEQNLLSGNRDKFPTTSLQKPRDHEYKRCTRRTFDWRRSKRTSHRGKRQPPRPRSSCRQKFLVRATHDDRSNFTRAASIKSMQTRS
jgi:DNA repair exonuclease SbcCD ATPase subunit